MGFMWGQCSSNWLICKCWLSGIWIWVFTKSSNCYRPGTKLPLLANSSMKYVLIPEGGFRTTGFQGLMSGEAFEVDEEGLGMKKMLKGFKLKFNIGNPSLRRLISGAIAGAVSRTAVAPLETTRTHLMVGSCGHNTTQVFQSIMEADGWKGFFRGNFVELRQARPLRYSVREN